VSDELAPRWAPIRGGGRCDICGNRSFRATRLGGYRHAGCEPSDRWLSPVERTARTQARSLAGTTPTPKPARGADAIAVRPNGHEP
jgi:hypothetical protein